MAGEAMAVHENKNRVREVLFLTEERVHEKKKLKTEIVKSGI